MCAHLDIIYQAQLELCRKVLILCTAYANQNYVELFWILGTIWMFHTPNTVTIIQLEEIFNSPLFLQFCWKSRAKFKIDEKKVTLNCSWWVISKWAHIILYQPKFISQFVAWEYPQLFSMNHLMVIARSFSPFTNTTNIY